MTAPSCGLFAGGCIASRDHRTRRPSATDSASRLNKAEDLGNAAAAIGRTDTFLGERYRRIARRRGKKKAIVAIGRSLLVIVWHLLSDEEARFHDLGSDFFTTRIDPERRKRNHVRQLEALGYKVTVTPAA